MKGLFAKDFSILNLRHIPLILALLTITGFFSILPWFSLVLAAIVTGWTTSTITTDQLDNGWPALFVLPVSRKQYVREKYILALLGANGFGRLAGLGSCLLWHLDAAQNQIVFAEVFALSALLTSVLIPVLFRWSSSGADKAVFVLGLACVFGLKLVQPVNPVVPFVFSPGIVALLILASLGLIAGSYALSIHILQTKDL